MLNCISSLVDALHHLVVNLSITLNFSSSHCRNFWKWLFYRPMWVGNQLWWSFGCCWCQSGQFIWGRSWIPWVDFSKVHKTLVQGHKLLARSSLLEFLAELLRTIQEIPKNLVRLLEDVWSKYHPQGHFEKLPRTSHGSLDNFLKLYQETKS